MRVLITSIGSTTSIGVTKFIKAIKRNIEITGTDTNFKNKISGSFFVHNYFQVPLNTDPGYVDEMLRIVKLKSIQILIPIHDLEMHVLSNETQKFKDLGCSVIVSAFSTVRNVNDKYAFAQLLQGSAILTPATYSVGEWEQKHFTNADCWILKPLHGVSSRGIHKGDTNKIKQLIGKKEINKSEHTIQAFVQGKEYTVDVFVKNKKAYCIVPRVREEVREGLCYKSYTLPNEKFNDPVNNIIALFDFYGPINIQFIEGALDKKLYCIECNPRFGGSSVTTLYAGVNLFQFILDDFEHKPITVCEEHKNIFMTRYWEEVVYEN